ncbi:MAG: phosphate/phosphite/phosphonate ABC transporter substrate-binding protein [Nitrospirae bacterium]|nr:phosphate/phosphite/phosphonate ABC transporter substrate-binding protein [Nitrospirota bacterium]
MTVDFRVLLVPLLALAGAASPVSADPETPSRTLTFGVLPVQSSVKLAGMFAPLLDHLSRETGVPFVFKTAPNFSAFLERVARGEYDVVYLAPNHYVRAHDQQGYQPLVRADEKTPSVLVVRKGAPLQQMGDLRGKTVAVASPQAWVTLLMKARMKEQGVDPKRDVTWKEVVSHDSALLAVRGGLADACITRYPSFHLAAPEVREQLRILVQVSSTLAVTIAVHPRVDPKMAQQVKTLLVTLHESEKGRSALDALRHPRFLGVTDRDYEAARKIVRTLQ